MHEYAFPVKSHMLSRQLDGSALVRRRHAVFVKRVKGKKKVSVDVKKNKTLTERVGPDARHQTCG